MNRWFAQAWPFLVSLMAAALVLLLPAPASAHEQTRGLVLADVPVGAYRLTTQVSPMPIRTGEVHVVTNVQPNPGLSGDCDIVIEVTPIDNLGPALIAQTHVATTAGQHDHEAQFVLAEEGRYQVRVTIRDRAGHGGQATFEIAVQPLFAWVVGLVYLQLVIAPVIGLWLVLQALSVWFPQFLLIRTG